MSGTYADFDEVDSFTVGALGQPGQRVFLMQCTAEGEHLTVKCEKQQAEAIATYLRRILDDVAEPAQPLAGVDTLTAPFEPEFVLGQIGLGYLADERRILVQLEEAGEVDEDGDPIENPSLGRIRLHLTLEQAYAFCERTDEALSGGRPLCRWCQFPIDPEGHACPRMN